MPAEKYKPKFGVRDARTRLNPQPSTKSFVF